MGNSGTLALLVCACVSPLNKTGNCTVVCLPGEASGSVGREVVQGEASGSVDDREVVQGEASGSVDSEVVLEGLEAKAGSLENV